MDRNLNDILLERILKAGFVPKLAVQFVLSLMKARGQLEDVNRYLGDEGLQLRVAQLIMATKPGLQIDDYGDVCVNSSAIPPLAVLKKGFSGGVSGVWDKRTWTRHRSLKHVAEVQGAAGFYLLRFMRKVTSDYVVTWAEINGYHVATHIEGLIFTATNPKVQLEREYVALGSFTVSGGSECVACFGHKDGKPVLGDSLFKGEWGPGTSFLLTFNPVREFETDESSVP